MVETLARVMLRCCCPCTMKLPACHGEPNAVLAIKVYARDSVFRFQMMIPRKMTPSNAYA